MRMLLTGLLLFTVGVDAADYKPLAGAYSIAGRTFYDPPPGEARNTHMYFALEGKAARDLYHAMRTRAVPSDCGADGSTLKQIGEMQCTRAAGGKEYRCWFGIDIKTQRIVNGVVC